MQTIISTGKLDLPLLKSVLKELYRVKGQTDYTREEVLELWAINEHKIESSKNTIDYLKTKLRDRLARLIEFLAKQEDDELYIKKEQPSRGAPRTFICLRVRDERNDSSIKTTEGEKMGKKRGMTKEAARRIQSASDKSGKNQDFKARAMSAAEKNK